MFRSYYLKVFLHAARTDWRGEMEMQISLFGFSKSVPKSSINTICSCGVNFMWWFRWPIIIKHAFDVIVWLHDWSNCGEMHTEMYCIMLSSPQSSESWLVSLKIKPNQRWVFPRFKKLWNSRNVFMWAINSVMWMIGKQMRMCNP